MRRVALFALLTLASGCAVQARTVVAPEPLTVPPVPPRVIVPEIDEIDLTPPPAEPVAAPRPAPRTDPPARPPVTDPPRTETIEPPRTEEAPRVRTPQTANDEQAERDVRSVLARAQGTLKGVDWRALSAAGKQQYDTARRFITAAENGLKIRNYVFARNLADKAETLARQLGK